jgi:hypothetical protein
MKVAQVKTSPTRPGRKTDRRSGGTRSRVLAAVAGSGLVVSGLTGLLVASPAVAAPTPVDTITKVVTFAPSATSPNVQTTYTIPYDALGVTVEVAGADGLVNAILSGFPIASKGADITSDLGTGFNGQTLNLMVGGVKTGDAPATGSIGLQGGGGSYLATDNAFLAIAGGGGGGGVYTSPSVPPPSGNIGGADAGRPTPGGTSLALSNGLQANGTGARAVIAK